MSQRVTQADVASLAGVHRATVSRVLDPDPARRQMVDPETVERVLSADRLSYTRNALARRLKTQRSQLTGLIAPAISAPDVAEVVDAYEARMREANFTTLVMSSAEDAGALQAVAAQLAELCAEGIVVITAKSADFVVDALGTNHGIPAVVMVGADNNLVSTVSIDHELGAHLGVAHLLRLGHRRIG